MLNRQLLRFAIVLVLWILHPTIQGQQQIADTYQEIVTPVSALDALTYSSDGTRLAVGGRDNVIRVYDLAAGALLMDTEGHTDWVTALLFSPDASHIISGSRDGSIRIFDTNSGTLIRVLGNHANHVTALVLTDDGILVSAGRDKTIKLWDMDSLSLITRFNDLGYAALDLALSPAGDTLASANDDGTITLWHSVDDSYQMISNFDTHQQSVTSITFSDDSDFLLSGGIDRNVRLWDLSDESQPELVEEYTQQAAVMNVAFDYTKQQIIIGCIDGTVSIHSIANHSNRILQHDSYLTNLALHPTQNELALIGISPNITLWQLDDIESLPTTSSITSQEIVPNTERYLSIPSVDISVGVTTFPIADGTWQIDPWEALAGHFFGTAWLNITGNVVIGAHSEMPNGNAGVFYELYDVGIGDNITLQDGDMMRQYVIVSIRTIDYRDLSVLRPTPFNRLTLITCDIPSWVVEQNIYYERLVIIADEIP